MISCIICGKSLKYVSNNHLIRHNMTVREYKVKYPDAKITDYDTYYFRTEMHRQRTKELWKDPLYLGKQVNNPAMHGDKVGENNPFYNHQHSAETIKHLSDVHSNNFLTGKECVHGYSTGFRADLGHAVRSKWEANVCRVLKYCGIKYEYESNNCRFDLIDCIYVCDLYLPDDEQYVEVKGYLRSTYKMRKFVNIYPDVKLRIIDGDAYAILKNRFKKLVNVWE
jgi:hypothetical protein